MKREAWQDLFWGAIDEARCAQFVWGEHDCVLFAAKVADAISDSGYLDRAKTAFSWNDVRSALELTRDGLQPLVESVLGPMMPWVRLSQGDIVLIVDDAGREALAVHDGCQLIGPADAGIKVIPFRCALGGWKVE